eukprot:gene14765-10560_t
MVGPDQIFNYVLMVYACIPDALFTYIGSKLYERTDGSSYLIGRLKFSGIGFCNMHVSEVAHYSPRFLSKEGMFSAIYGTAPISTSASSTNLPGVSHQDIQPATSSESQASASADPYLDTSIIESFHEDNVQDLEAQLKAAIAGETSVGPSLVYSSRESPSLEVAGQPKSTEDVKTAEEANSFRGGHANAPIMMSKRNNRKKTATSVPIPLEKILVSTPSSRYYVGARRKTPYKLDLDVTMVFHIDPEWKIWKCETYNRDALQAIYNATDGPDWIWDYAVDSNPWNFAAINDTYNPCTGHWEGISCTSNCQESPCSILYFILDGANLNGQLPDVFGAFPNILSMGFDNLPFLTGKDYRRRHNCTP